nr:MAG TPA: hypothetical protein [Caudoviricetes sp.]
MRLQLTVLRWAFFGRPPQKFKMSEMEVYFDD